MDAWESLIAGSTIASGDAWEHLQAQGGGSGTTIINTDGMVVYMEAADFTAEVEETSINVDVSYEDLSVDISITPIEVEI